MQNGDASSSNTVESKTSSNQPMFEAFPPIPPTLPGTFQSPRFTPLAPLQFDPATEFKFVFSGDCRPSDRLCVVGRDATLCVHEATFEDALADEARGKMHCTVGEAVGVGEKMAARNLLLTHFSQRYPKIPTIHPHHAGTVVSPFVAIAFDMMRLRLSDFPLGEKMVTGEYLASVVGNEDGDDEDSEDDEGEDDIGEGAEGRPPGAVGDGASRDGPTSTKKRKSDNGANGGKGVSNDGSKGVRKNEGGKRDLTDRTASGCITAVGSAVGVVGAKKRKLIGSKVEMTVQT